MIQSFIKTIHLWQDIAVGNVRDLAETFEKKEHAVETTFAAQTLPPPNVAEVQILDTSAALTSWGNKISVEFRALNIGPRLDLFTGNFSLQV